VGRRGKRFSYRDRGVGGRGGGVILSRSEMGNIRVGRGYIFWRLRCSRGKGMVVWCID
jgi:hypothetical protein